MVRCKRQNITNGAADRTVILTPAYPDRCAVSRDVAENRSLGDVTTLTDSSVMNLISEKLPSAKSEDWPVVHSRGGRPRTARPGCDRPALGTVGRRCAGKSGRRFLGNRPGISPSPEGEPLRRPYEAVRYAAQIAEALRTETIGGVIMLIATVLALIWANSPWSGTYEALRSVVVPGPLHLTLYEWAADGLLATLLRRRGGAEGGVRPRGAVPLPRRDPAGRGRAGRDGGAGR